MKIPILYVGPPGVGKTAVIRSQYDHCEVLLLSSQTEEDIAGIPYRDGANEKRTIPQYIQRLQAGSDKKKTCLFLDELDKARREVADTLLTLITHPQDFGIPDNTHIVAAANPPEWGGGDGISLPMMNRFAIVDFEVNIDSWESYMVNKYGSSEFLTNVLNAIRSNKFPFLEVNGEGLAWRLTSPRSLDNAIGALLHNIDGAKDIVKGLVTPNVASGLLLIHNNSGATINPVKTSDEIQLTSRGIGASAIKRKPLIRDFR